MNVYLAKQVLNRFAKFFAEKYTKDQAWKARFDSGDDAIVDQLIDQACRDLRADRDSFENFVERTPELRALQKRLLQQIVLGPLGTHGVESKGADGSAN